MTVMLGVELFARLVCLAIGKLPARTTAGNVIDSLILIVMLIWLAAVWK